MEVTAVAPAYVQVHDAKCADGHPCNLRFSIAAGGAAIVGVGDYGRRWQSAPYPYCILAHIIREAFMGACPWDGLSCQAVILVQTVPCPHGGHGEPEGTKFRVHGQL